MRNKPNTINISITPQIEAWIAEQLASGWYNNASELARDAFRVLREEQEIRAAKLRDVRAAIEEGMNSPAAPWEGAEAIKKLARERHAAKHGELVTQG